MHPKNTTAICSTQESGPPEQNETSQLPPQGSIFSPEQVALAVRLLAAERAHASRWWTFLQELRLHRQLPEWVEKQVVGCHPDYDRWSADCLTTNRALLGIDGHLNAFDESQLIDCSVGTFLGTEPGLAPQNEEVPFRGAHGGEA